MSTTTTTPTPTPASAQEAANAPEAWARRRAEGAVPRDPRRADACPTFWPRLEALANAVAWAFGQRPDRPRAVLDVAAGAGWLGRVLREEAPGTVYHATEQGADALPHFAAYLPFASVAVWRFESGGETLRDALAAAPAPFLPAYPVVVLSHVLEHVADYYGLLHQAWDMTEPGGALVVCAPCGDEHETHLHRFDWGRLLGVLRQFGAPGAPVATWPRGGWADLLAAVCKPADEGGTP